MKDSYPKFYESLYILTHLYDNITYLSEIMQDNDFHVIHTDSDLPEKQIFHFIALFRHIIMETCSFMEEYENNLYQLAELEYQERIRECKKIVKPAAKKIKEWKDLKKMRNEFIAHSWRDSSTNEFSYRKIFEYNAPRTYFELQVMRKYVTIIVGVLEAEFQEELTQLPHYIRSIHKEPHPPKQLPDVFAEMTTVIEEINASF